MPCLRGVRLSLGLSKLASGVLVLRYPGVEVDLHDGILLLQLRSNRVTAGWVGMTTGRNEGRCRFRAGPEMQQSGERKPDSC